MRVFIRADASVQIGSGHVMRCLTLADSLTTKGLEVLFISRELPGNLCDLVQEKGYKVYRLPYKESLISGDTCWEADAAETEKIIKENGGGDWLVVDHYYLDCRWERQLRQFIKKVMVIDDLADRPHDCDLLLDQNLYKNLESRYDGLLPKNCNKLLGPRYALLRQEFAEARNNPRSRDGQVRRIFIFFGGCDVTNETAKALEAMRLLNRPEIALDVVVGVTNPHKADIKEICASMPNASYHCQVGNMAELMSNADLAIGAGGTTTWERCFLGLPSLTIVLAENQREVTTSAATAGATLYLGQNSEVSSTKLASALEEAIISPDRLKEVSDKAFQLMGGSGKSPGNECILAQLCEDQC
jgi:UDP-2,4-diacetamido-2,4,6-trideoxy-beta-L-altropyranose hydrolase